MITTDTRDKLGITVAKDLRTVMQGNVAIAGEASYEGARQVFNGAVDRHLLAQREVEKWRSSLV